jgi:hypothetical protein
MKNKAIFTTNLEQGINIKALVGWLVQWFLYILLLLGWKFKWCSLHGWKEDIFHSPNGRLSVVRLNAYGLGFRVCAICRASGCWWDLTDLISHQNPFVLIQFPNNFHQIPLVPIKFQSNSFCSHQIPLVPLNNPSLSFCSHQVPKQFPSNSSCSHKRGWNNKDHCPGFHSLREHNQIVVSFPSIVKKSIQQEAFVHLRSSTWQILLT